MFNHNKYQAFQPINNPDRQWPNKVISQAPEWCSVDLRDGNQALVNPMSVEQKKALFQLLVDMGFKQIEVGFPAASQPDFDFVRWLIEEDQIPEGVSIQVLTQARQALIERTFEAVKGAKNVIVHLYNSTSPVQREQVFGLAPQGIVDIAVQGAKWVRDLAEQRPETAWQFEYSPESFSATELPFAVEICAAVHEVWRGVGARPVIFNLPATVEMATPNIYADQIEWFCRELPHRDEVMVSVHTHNDRGCAVAAAELAVMAGADRVEGALMGNGERTGNMDLVTMGMNLYSQGIDPQLDFSDMQRIVNVVEYCTEIAVPVRHPYAGELVYTAFSGSHQDAIRKCLNKQQPEQKWNVAYLPIDPKDVGRDYEAVIRINSQSGKGGAAYVVERILGCQLPRWMQQAFAKVVQQETETKGREITQQEIMGLFEKTYAVSPNQKQASLVDNYHIDTDDGASLQATVTYRGEPIAIKGEGHGVLEAVVNAMAGHVGAVINIVHYEEQSLGETSEAQAMAFIEVAIEGQRKIGVACDQDVVKASIEAVMRSVSM